LCTAGGRNNPAFVINTSPELLRMLTYTTLEIVESMPMVIQHRRDVLIDPNAGIGDISETFPGAKVLRHVPGTRAKDKRFNDEVDRLHKELHLRKERVKLISQVFTVARASPYSLSHTDDVVAIAFWAANMIRIKEGEIPPVPDGYQRKVPASLPEVSKDTRVMPAPLKIYQPNVFTGITPATLHLYAGRPVPRLHRTESEVQPSIEEAYPDGVC
jgi:hypothetical protein